MSETDHSVQNVLDKYQEFLLQQQQGSSDPSQTIFLLQQVVEEAKHLNRPALLAALLLKLGRFLLEHTGRIQDAVHAFTAGGMLLQEDPAYQYEMNKAIGQLQGMRKGYQGSSEVIPDIYIFDIDEHLPSAEKDPLLPVKLVVNAGNCYLEMGQETQALGYFQAARKLPSIDQSPMLRAKVQANEAELWRRKGDLQQADALLQQAQAYFAGNDVPTDAKEFYAILAQLRRQQDKLTEAVQYYEKAVACYAQSSDLRGYGRTLTSLAQLYLDRGDFVRAQNCFTRALEMAQKTTDDNNKAFAHRGLALCYLQDNEPAKAIEHLEASIQSMDAVLATLRTEQGKISRIDSMEGAMNTLLDSYRAMLKDPNNSGKWERIILQRIDQFHGMVLDDILQGIMRANCVTEEVKPGEEGLGISGFQSPAGSMNMMVQQAVADYTPFFGRTIERPKRSQVTPFFRLVYHLTEDNLFIVIDHPHRQPFVYSKKSARSFLRRKVEHLHQTLHTGQSLRGFRGILPLDRPSGGQAQDQAVYRDLYRWLIEPVADHLPEEGSLLIIEPHDILHVLPFAALQDDHGAYFGEKYVLQVSPSQDTFRQLQSYEPYHSDIKSGKSLVVGNPQMKSGIEVNGKIFGGFSSLAGAEKEAAFIQGLFPPGQSIYLKNSEAHAEAIREAAQSSGLIHLATHGLADEQEPMDSFLVVAGEQGYVTAREIRNWRIPADLVVLSACETALGRLANTEGIIGLARALFIAGARTVVVSLWSVHDWATALLMEHFYRALLAGAQASYALQTAQLAVKQNPTYSAPVYWAGFMVVGAV